jgi:hypothetical protein
MVCSEWEAASLIQKIYMYGLRANRPLRPLDGRILQIARASALRQVNGVALKRKM